MNSAPRNHKLIDNALLWIASMAVVAFCTGFVTSYDMLSSKTCDKIAADKNEEVPIASLLIPLIIRIGTAIEARRRQPLSDANDEIDSEQDPFSIPNINETIESSHGVVCLTIYLDGNGSLFLKNFYESIEPVKGLIHLEHLLQHPNHSFACGFRVLLDELRKPWLEWLKVDQDGRWYVPDTAYFPLVTWIREEIIRQCELEADIYDELGVTEQRCVLFQLPSKCKLT